VITAQAAANREKAEKTQAAFVASAGTVLPIWCSSNPLVEDQHALERLVFRYTWLLSNLRRMRSSLQSESKSQKLANGEPCKNRSVVIADVEAALQESRDRPEGIESDCNANDFLKGKYT
jgi:hypothetical protein